MSSGSRSKGKERATATAMAGRSAASMLAPLVDQLLAGGFISKPLDASRWDSEEAAKLEHCLSTMLARTTSAQQDLARLMDKHRGLASDFDRLEQAEHKRRQTLETSEYEKEQAKAKASAAIKELAAEQAKHAQARDEIQKARLALSSVKSAAQHESKRRENEVASVMSRWQKISSSSSSVQQAAIVLNTQDKISRIDIPVANTGRETPSGTALLEESLRRADDEKHAMQEENIHLREVMGDVLNEVKATLSSMNVDIPSLQETLDDSVVHVTSLHLALSPNDMMDYLSKLLIALREAALQTLQASEEAVSVAQASARKDAMSKVNELEVSLSQMQADLDAARLEAQEARELYESAQVSNSTAQAEASKKADLANSQTKRVKAELEESKKMYSDLKARYEREKAAIVEARSELENTRAELTSLKKRAADTDASADASTFKRAKLSAQSQVDSSLDSSHGARHKAMVVPERRARRTMRESTTSAALKNILASAADTPPNRPAPLSSKQVNLQISPQNTHKSAVSFHKSEVQMSKVGDSTAPSSAALAAKDRIRKAVDAAKARNGPDVHSKNVTQRKR